MPSLPEFPRAVCFDLYGTLVDISIDTESPKIWETLSVELRSTGVSVEPRALHYRYHKLVEAETNEHGQPFVLGSLFFFKLLSHGGRVLGGHKVRYFGRRFRALTTRRIKLKPFASELFHFLRSKACKLAIVSNTEEIVTSHDLDELDIRRHFDTVVLSSVVGVKKPEARIFHLALRQLKVSARDCVFIGDDYNCDYLGSQRAGLRPVLLCDQEHHDHHHRHSDAFCVPPLLGQIVHAIEHCPTPSTRQPISA
jgi:HAD superfamily hydrolase (TIGR01509 family)